MHDGSLSTLKDVVEFYNRGGNRNENSSPFIIPLELNKEEKQDIVEFSVHILPESK